MKEIQEKWRALVFQSLSSLWPRAEGLSLSQVVFEIPPRPELGDLAFPMFPFAKSLRAAPPLIARQVAEKIGTQSSGDGVSAAGAYVNVKFLRPAIVAQTLRDVLNQKDLYGSNKSLSGRRIMIEFSSPNTNKPLHIGHLRNNALGESTSRILAFCGAEVRKVNLINDRGVHICKSMLAYKEFGGGRTPDSEGIKSDRFVGDYYVKFAQWAEQNPEAEIRAQELLRLWEAGDGEVRALWSLMNGWALDGVSQTYRRTGIRFDRIYKESETYLSGKDEVLRGLETGAFRRREDAAVVADLPWKENPEDPDSSAKVLLRPDGTSVYMTQDLGTAVARQADWPFGELVYVVASEQDYHFKVLFHLLEKLGYDWARRLYHLSYGMVKLPDGSKIKSRQGTTADADDILDELAEGARAEILAKGRENEVDGLAETAESIGLAALHYFLLRVTPAKDMIFHPQESLAFDGNTGPYLLYTGARICSMLAKLEAEPVSGVLVPEKLSTAEEWELIKLLGIFPEIVERSGQERDPSVLAGFTYDLARSFSKFYHEHSILNNADPDLVVSRVRLSEAVLAVLKTSFGLLNIPFLRRM